MKRTAEAYRHDSGTAPIEKHDEHANWTEQQIMAEALRIVEERDVFPRSPERMKQYELALGRLVFEFHYRNGDYGNGTET